MSATAQSATIESVQKLSKDLRDAAVTLSAAEARFLVDAYYIIQEDRKRSDNQIRSLRDSGEPHEILNWFADQNRTLESQLKAALDRYSSQHPVGRWSKSIIGVGPVISAGLLAHIDITKAPTVGHIWRFAGLDPTVRWEKGCKRPWNAELKTLCVHPDCHVTTRRGPVPISNIMVGDEVLTHQGRWRRVTKVYVNHHNDWLHGLRGARSGNQTAWLTPGHPVYAAPVETWQSGRTYKPNEKTRQPFDWHAVDSVRVRWNLLRPVLQETTLLEEASIQLEGVDQGVAVAAEGRWTGTPHPRARPVTSEIPLDQEVMRLIGLYLAEGHINRTTIHWSYGQHEWDLANFTARVLSRFVTDGVSADQTDTGLQVRVGCKPLSDAFAHLFGCSGDEMKIPGEWLGLPVDLLEALWCGVMDGDGDHVGAYKDRRISVTNPVLARQLVDVGRRIGLSVSLHTERGNRAYRIHVNERSDRHPSAIEVSPAWYTGSVYNLEVEEDHSYVVEGYAVHNCWKIGECFVKVSGKEESLYGKLYRDRKEQEIERNEQLAFSDQAERALSEKNISKNTDAYAYYSVGKLPPAHIHARAKRYAVKIFLAHWHHVAYYNHYGEQPPKPYVIEHLGHAHYIAPPEPNH